MKNVTYQNVPGSFLGVAPMPTPLQPLKDQKVLSYQKVKEMVEGMILSSDRKPSITRTGRKREITVRCGETEVMFRGNEEDPPLFEMIILK